MSAERDFDALIRSWLEDAGESAHSQDLLESVLSDTARNRPRPRWLVRLGGDPMPKEAPGLNRFALIGASVVIAIIAASLAIALIGRPWRNVGPEPVGSQTPSPTADASETADAGSWSLTGSMHVGASGDDAVLLRDGRVLLRGELYDPTIGTWSTTNGPTTPQGSTETLLADGRVLAVGGNRAEIFDPSSGNWTPTGRMIQARTAQTATLLRDGRVLVAGGMGTHGTYDYLSSAEVYDPSAGTWSNTGHMLAARGEHGIGNRAGHTATLLGDGRVLVTGGRATPFASLASAEIYDPASGTWTATGSMAEARQLHTATLLENGLVLVVGDGAELYDPQSGTWRATGSPPIRQSTPTATLLSDGRVLVLGSSIAPAANAQLYDPATGTWSSAGLTASSRSYHAAVLLSDGTVLVAGGESLIRPNVFGPERSAELYHP